MSIDSSCHLHSQQVSCQLTKHWLIYEVTSCLWPPLPNLIGCNGLIVLKTKKIYLKILFAKFGEDQTRFQQLHCLTPNFTTWSLILSDTRPVWQSCAEVLHACGLTQCWVFSNISSRLNYIVLSYLSSTLKFTQSLALSSICLLTYSIPIHVS